MINQRSMYLFFSRQTDSTRFSTGPRMNCWPSATSLKLCILMISYRNFLWTIRLIYNYLWRLSPRNDSQRARWCFQCATVSALHAIARPSVRPSVCPSVTRVDQSKTVEVRIMQLSPQGKKNTQFSANKSPYLRNGASYDQGYYDELIIIIYYA